MSTEEKQSGPAGDLVAELNAFEDFINIPPQYEEMRMVRDYRHELARKWTPLRDFISRLSHRAGEARTVEWQPIETAPKDGTEILAYRDGIYFACMFGPKCGWFNPSIDEMDDTLQEIYRAPTQWQPLPSPPRTQGDGM